MRTVDQMQAVLLEFPGVSKSLDDLAEEHGDLQVATVEDFGYEPLINSAKRMSGRTHGWFLAMSDDQVFWMISPDGITTDVTAELEGRDR
jgi:hypothetical protein